MNASFRSGPGGRANTRKTRHTKIAVQTQWEATKFDEFYRDLNALLNKMSDQNFELLQDKLLKMKGQIEDVLEALEVLVKLVFEKALAAPNFAPLYGNLCVILSTQLSKSFTRTKPDGTADEVDFRKLLLEHCRKNFEACFQPVPEEDLIKPDDDAYTVADKTEKEFKRKRRLECNITFIAELFIRKLLFPRILFAVIENLFGKENNQLQKPDAFKVELACKLIATLGPRLEDPTPSAGGNISILQRTDVYFAYVSTRTLCSLSFSHFRTLLEDKDKYNFRTRCMIQDLLDLRKDGWIPRKIGGLAPAGDPVLKSSAGVERYAHFDVFLYSFLLQNHAELLAVLSTLLA